MTEPARESASPSLRWLWGLAAGVVVLGGLRAGRALLAPLAFSLFLALLALPLFDGLRRRRVPTGVAVLVTMALIGVVMALFAGLLLGSLAEFREVGPHYYRSLQERAQYTVEWWEGKGISLPDWIPPRYRSPEAIVELAGGTVRGAFLLATETTVVLLTLVFLLFEAAAFPEKLARLPAPVRAGVRQFARVSGELQRFLWIKTAMSALIGVAAGLWVALLGLDFPVLCGLIAFACHFIPNIGAVLVAAPAMVIAFVQYDPAKALAVAVGYLTLGLLLGNLLEPALMGRRLGLSPLAVFVSLVVWGWLWGPVGMFLSVPLTMALKMLLESSPGTRWVAVLLDGGAGAPAGAAATPLGDPSTPAAAAPPVSDRS